RLSDTRLDLGAVARDAARAASHDPHNATATAEFTVARTLQDQHVPCAPLAVSTRFESYSATGLLIHVTITCTVTLADLAPWRVARSKTVIADAAEPLDRYRNTP